MTAKICLISPGHLSTNPRLVKEAKALINAGYSVHVVHGSYVVANIEFDHTIASDFSSCIGVPFGPATLDKINYTLVAARQKFARTAFGAGVRVQSIADLSHSQATPGLTSAACAVPADLYIAHYVAALPAAAAAARLHGGAYAFDAEDFHLGDLPDRPEYALEKRIIRTIEGEYLPGAAFVTAASPLIAEAYAEAYDIPKPTVILNVFPKDNGPPEPTQRGSVKPGPSLYWFSQTIGAGRGLETAIAAIALAKSKPHLHLRGTFASGYEATLRAHAARHGVSERLHIHRAVAPDVLELAGADFDIGYVGETGFSRNNNFALANKIFSYLTSGLPILASNTQAHAAISDKLAGAFDLFSIGDAQALAGGIDRLLCNPSKLAHARRVAWTLGRTEWNWEHEAPLLVKLVRSRIR